MNSLTQMQARALTRPAPVTREVATTRIACDGLTENAALGHPRVWLTIPADSDFIDCPYCDARYIRAPGAAEGH
ncbi:zinc-finger domain-containing protein [Ketogulonicigenium vulgare]|uniref:Zinc finger CHCC-type domain-containing protein n=1 Tax=Ketogulonicigenium vulgare (strain WSH-001) TaxID=759362 RepID=F9Y9L1_KETVW|nr:zinc-finger domain-containing protein [Ketogulonicigenium vulgare]ADO41367.1 conserved hypothetical protein [Ketogulonicigenium vulgare Y25]AEM41349.1 hypothetical protein KVU_1510 [Ketogulonicigenium vulgare WSH-001]ALJ82359.1 hypothetical protein KVH_10040 [Ketogulonicigenium vulgare]ANW35098.1 hypothetical protein KvSKV_09985 [Ketogulonicigenium vulgare]AOZ55090.1 hypothetical protein KVC_2083 [Ketogulonicigenium vulgare]